MTVREGLESVLGAWATVDQPHDTILPRQLLSMKQDSQQRDIQSRFDLIRIGASSLPVVCRPLPSSRAG